MPFVESFRLLVSYSCPPAFMQSFHSCMTAPPQYPHATPTEFLSKSFAFAEYITINSRRKVATGVAALPRRLTRDLGGDSQRDPARRFRRRRRFPVVSEFRYSSHNCCHSCKRAFAPQLLTAADAKLRTLRRTSELRTGFGPKRRRLRTRKHLRMSWASK